MFGRKPRKETNKIKVEGRVLVLTLVLLFIAVMIVGRLFYMQIINHNFYIQRAEKSQETSKNLASLRGSIYTREKDGLYPVVTNRDYYLLYAEPKNIKDAKNTASQITDILGLDSDESKEILAKLSKNNDPYEPLRHKVEKKLADQIKELKIDGVGFVPEPYRFYPDKGIGGQVFGYVSTAENEPIGLYGLEGYFNKELSGQSGIIKSFRDALGSLITIGSRTVKKAENGSNLILTLNREIQFTTCQKLEIYYKKFSAAGATAIIMTPTGEIIAMCNLPDYDPENYKEVKDINYFNNPAIFTAYEPGSVYKAFTMAAGLDSGAVTPQTTYNDTGEVKINGFTIRNSDLKGHGVMNMVDVLEHSLNTGAIFVEQKIGKDQFKKYMKSFGFGNSTGITLDKEMPGDISSLNQAGEIFGMTGSFGQGITATPIQLVTAFAAIANQGKLPKPYIVSEIDKANGEKEIFKPVTVRQVISSKTASILSGMLTSVVERGYGKKAGVSGYYFAGKTGTAQIATAGGYGNEYNHTFIGFGPVSNPKFVILVKLEKPKGVRFAEDTITPLFHDLAEFMLNYYQIPPDY